MFLMEKFYEIRIVFTGSRLPMKENCIVISNHQQITDIPVLMALAWRKGRLGDLKWFVKDIIKYIPGPGWGMQFLGCVFVKRSWADDRASIEETFRHIKVNKLNTWWETWELK